MKKFISMRMVEIIKLLKIQENLNKSTLFSKFTEKLITVSIKKIGKNYGIKNMSTIFNFV